MSRPRDLSDDLAAKALRTTLVDDVTLILGVTRTQAKEIVEAFDAFVAVPLEKNLAKLRGRDLAKRNPMIYTVRGTTMVADWVNRVLEDRETSAIEGHLGTFLEEVARIVSGGIKPGNGVDLQTNEPDGVVRLYAIQAAPNTKNSGSRQSDIQALKRAARPLRAAKRHVELNIAVLSGRSTTGAVQSDPEIAMPASDEFWARVSGIADFRSRLLEASIVLSRLIKSRASDEVTRIKAEAQALFADAGGALSVDALANPASTAQSLKGTLKIEE